MPVIPPVFYPPQEPDVTLYVVESWLTYDSSTFHGVFDSPERARAYTTGQPWVKGEPRERNGVLTWYTSDGGFSISPVTLNKPYHER